MNCSEDLIDDIGDVEVDDTDLTGADEDELLLSDDGKSCISIFTTIRIGIKRFPSIHRNVLMPTVTRARRRFISWYSIR